MDKHLAAKLCTPEEADSRTSGGDPNDPDRMTQAIARLRRTLAATADDDPARARYLGQLGIALCQRYERTGRRVNLDRAVEAFEEASAASPWDDPDHAVHLYNLAIALWTEAKSEPASERGNLDRAADALRDAVTAAPAEDPRRELYQVAFGDVLVERSRYTGDVTDVDEAVDQFGEAVLSVGLDQVSRAACLLRLHGALLRRYELTNQAPDLDRAVVVLDQAVHAMAPHYPGRAGYLHDLAVAWRARSERTGDVGDLDRAIESFRVAVQHSPEAGPDRARRQFNLGAALADRYAYGGAPVDLDQAVEALDQAADHPSDYPERAGYLLTIGALLGHRFERTGEPADQERAADALRHAVRVITGEEPGADRRGHALARLRATGELDELDTTIGYLEREVTAQRYGAARPYLGAAFARRYEYTGEPVDLQRAAESFRTVVSASPSGLGPRWYQFNLAATLAGRYQLTGDVVDLNRTADALGQIATAPVAEDQALDLFSFGAELALRLRSSPETSSKETLGSGPEPFSLKLAPRIGEPSVSWAEHLPAPLYAAAETGSAIRWLPQQHHWPFRATWNTVLDVPVTTTTAWPRLDAPPAVVGGQTFDVVVGLGEHQDLLLDGTGLLELPAADFTLGVELLVDSFGVVGDRTFALQVTAENRYPTRTVKLIAASGAGLAERRRIGVVYRLDHEMRGYAGREIVVKATAAEAAAVQVTATGGGPGRIDTAPFTAPDAADLTVVIQYGDAADGSRLIWSAASPRVAIQLPANPAGPLIPPAQEFLEELVAEASSTTDALDLVTSLHGRGKAEIAPLIPKFVKRALRDAARAVAPRPATVLLLSQDPYVPWELAVLDPPLPGWSAGGSPFLGAQTVIGRWVLAAEPPPKLDPPKQVSVRGEAVIAGVYEKVPDWKRLLSAEHEAEELHKRWPAACAVDATLPAVLDCLNGTPEADIIHFALHGEFSTETTRQGLVLIGTVEGHPERRRPVFLKPDHVDSGKLARAPLVFLNACQVGAGRLVLGNYSGMAGAFIRVGASAVVAPLWSVDDEEASGLALDFYTQVLGAGESPAEVLRANRAKVTKAAVKAQDPAASGTHLAYQFFGHPNLRLAQAPAAQAPDTEAGQP